MRQGGTPDATEVRLRSTHSRQGCPHTLRRSTAATQVEQAPRALQRTAAWVGRLRERVRQLGVSAAARARAQGAWIAT